jgi:hypothetical protein
MNDGPPHSIITGNYKFQRPLHFHTGSQALHIGPIDCVPVPLARTAAPQAVWNTDEVRRQLENRVGIGPAWWGSMRPSI